MLKRILQQHPHRPVAGIAPERPFQPCDGTGYILKINQKLCNRDRIRPQTRLQFGLQSNDRVNLRAGQIYAANLLVIQREIDP
jgi:hypothetical protein